MLTGALLDNRKSVHRPRKAIAGRSNGVSLSNGRTLPTSRHSSRPGIYGSQLLEEPMNVVVATDGSEAAIGAAQKSMELLRPGAHVAVVMVIPAYEDPMEDAGGIEGPAISPERAEKDWQKATDEGQAALDRTAAVIGSDAEVRLVPDDESTGAAVVRVAQDVNADVLVIGSSSRGWLSRLLGGSVSDYVIHHASCPVLLVRHDH
jgi:nucleotide-binding universal stress UspA family protein